MNPLSKFNLAIGGMELGLHRFEFVLDDDFLSQFEQCPYQEASVQVIVELDKSSNMIELNVHQEGWLMCQCDRCLAPIQLPVNFKNRVFLKSKDRGEGSKTEDVIYIELGQSKFSVAPLLYDLFLLAVPIKKAYDCEREENRPCDIEILDRLDVTTGNIESNDSSLWDELRNKLN